MLTDCDRDAEFFKQAQQFFAEYNWIFKYSNTEYLARGVLHEIPTEWSDFCLQMSNEELNDLPTSVNHNSKIPASLRLFLEQLKSLQQQMIFHPYKETPTTPTNNSRMKGISAKKSHEIQRFTAELHQILSRTAGSSPSDHILIDIGCGLGYLSQQLHSQFGYRVLGIEADAQRVASARSRQLQLHPQSVGSVFYSQHYVKSAEESARHIEQQCAQHFAASAGNSRLVIIGLHPCAQLTVIADNLLLHMPSAAVLAIIPCCYHKMYDSCGRAGVLSGSIPLSRSMQSAVEDREWRAVVGIPFLRLASQQTAANWRRMTAAEHCKHGAAMWDRAVLQATLQDGERLVAAKHSVNPESCLETLACWPILQKFALQSGGNVSDVRGWSESHFTRAAQIKSQHPNGARISEFLTGLQATIQSLCEYVVLFDRVCYLKEQLQSTDELVYLRKLFCEQLSPRSFQLVARKTD